MHNFTRLNEGIKGIAKGVYESTKATKIMFGEVTSEKPLKVLVDQRLELTDAQLLLSRNVTNHTVEIEITEPNLGNTIIEGFSRRVETDKITGKMLIKNKLKKGEKVIILRQEGGQKFLILDRIGEKK